MIEQFATTIALGRVVEPEDVGRAIAFLAGANASWITVEVIQCSGGQGL